MTKTKKTATRKCSDCIHSFACGAWNVGSLDDADAAACHNYTTLEGSTAYFIGYREGQKAKEKEIEMNRSIECLNDGEFNSYIGDLTELAKKATREIINVADKHRADRDETARLLSMAIFRASLEALPNHERETSYKKSIGKTKKFSKPQKN